jgi:hypothetical protein
MTVTAERYNMRRLPQAGAIVWFAAAIANTVIRFIAVALFNPPSEFLPLGIAQPIVFSFFGVLGATIAWWLVATRARAPERTYRIVAAIALLLSWLPDLTLLGGLIPGATIGTVGSLMLMHVVAATLCVTLLPRLTRGG